jgi:hypothetical protein
VSAAEPLPGRTDTEPLSPVAMETYQEREAQHLPPTVRDPRALAAVARLVNEPPNDCPPAREVRRGPSPEVPDAQEAS